MICPIHRNLFQLPTASLFTVLVGGVGLTAGHVNSCVYHHPLLCVGWGWVEDVSLQWQLLLGSRLGLISTTFAIHLVGGVRVDCMVGARLHRMDRQRERERDERRCQEEQRSFMQWNYRATITATLGTTNHSPYNSILVKVSTLVASVSGFDSNSCSVRIARAHARPTDIKSFTYFFRAMSTSFLGSQTGAKSPFFASLAK